MNRINLWSIFHFQVIDVLLNECNLIYECKVCFNMFRSMANLIAHKRSYCKSRCKTVLHHFNNGDKQSKDTVENLVMVEPEPVETVYPEDTFELEDYSPSIELLKDAGILSEIEERPIIESLIPVSSNQHSKSKLQDIVKKLITVRNAQESEDEKNPLLLEPIRQTSRAMFQVSTYPHYSKSQIFVQKFNFEKIPTFSRVFQPFFFDNFSREIKVVNS